MQHVIKRAFGTGRCKVHVVTNKEEILERARTNCYECLLLDLHTIDYGDTLVQVRSDPDPGVKELLAFGKFLHTYSFV